MKMYFSLQKNVFLSPDRFLQILKAFPPGVWSQIGRKFIPFKLLDEIDLSKTYLQIKVVLMLFHDCDDDPDDDSDDVDNSGCCIC